MAGSMNWTGMDELKSAVEQARDDWTSTADAIKTEAVNKLNEGYTGNAAETTATKMDEVIKTAKNFFDQVAVDIANKLAEQKSAWEDQEKKAQSSVEG